MATGSKTDEELSQLEKDVRQFKIEYEQYFGGGKSRPPSDTEWRIDTMMKRYGDRGAQMSFSQRYRYNNLLQTYAKYREIFRKRLKKREEGGQERHFGTTAREIEADRSRKKAADARAELARRFPFSVCCKDPERERKKVEQLYAALREAKEQAGEGTEKLSLVAFQNFLRQKSDLLKNQKGAHEVEYVVTVEGKHARLKARVKG
jgi:hypothetical protein